MVHGTGRVTAPRLFSIFSRQGKREKTESGSALFRAFLFSAIIEPCLVVKFHTIVSSYNYLHLT
jgi:hypothetical protein